MESMGILASIPIPESVWKPGNKLLLSSVDKIKNVDIFERYFKSLMNETGKITYPSKTVQTDVHGFDYSIDALGSENHYSILSWMKGLRKRNYFVSDGRSRLSTSSKIREELELKRRNFALIDIEVWKSLETKSESLISEDKDIFSVICASHTGQLLPKIDWATSNPDNCSAFDRQSNNRVTSKTYEMFPQFTYAFASLGEKSGTAKSEMSWSKREYPPMFVYYYHVKDSNDNPIVFSMLSTIGTDSKPVDVLLASPEALTLAEAPVISSEIVDYLESISDAIRNGGIFKMQSTRKKGFSNISFGEASRWNHYTPRGPLWGVGKHGSSPTSFRFQLDKMICAMKDLQIIAKDLKIHPSSEKLISAKESEMKFRTSYNMLLSMHSWKKNNQFDGVSRGVVRGDMKAISARIEKILGLTSRRLGMGISQQVNCGFNEVGSTKLSFGGGLPISATWDPRTRSGTFKHISSTHRLYFEELDFQNLLGKDTVFSGSWKSHDNSTWIPEIIAFPRSASYFDSRLASDERIILKKIKTNSKNEKYIDGALIIDIMSKKNPQKSKGEQYLQIKEETPLILSATYARGDALYECDMHTRNTRAELENPEIIALTVNHYVNAVNHFKESGHDPEGKGGQETPYVSETRRTWKIVLERFLPNLESSEIDSLLSTAKSLYLENTFTQQWGNISNEDARGLAKIILQSTNHIDRSDLIESITRILRKS